MQRVLRADQHHDPDEALRGLDRKPDKAASARVEFVYGALQTTPQRVGRELRLVARQAERAATFAWSTRSTARSVA